MFQRIVNKKLGGVRHDKVLAYSDEIGVDGIRPGVRKVKAVTEFPTPTNVHGVRQFVDLASYFRKLVKGFALLA